MHLFKNELYNERMEKDIRSNLIQHFADDQIERTREVKQSAPVTQKVASITWILNLVFYFASVFFSYKYDYTRKGISSIYWHKTNFNSLVIST